MIKAKVDWVIEQIAIREHTTPDEVRSQMLEALTLASQATDPEIRAVWDTIPRKGDVPTLEEFFEHFSK